MKLGRIALQGPDGDVARLVLVLPEEGRVVDLKRAHAALAHARGATRDAALRVADALFPGSMSAAIALGEDFLDAARAVADKVPDAAPLSIDGLKWLPATDPKIVRDGLTFIDHIKGFHEKMKLTPAPSLLRVPGYFKGTTTTMVGHEAEIPWPGFVNRMDYELELGWIVGRPGKDLDPSRARSHLFGVTIFNDCSARDRQADEFAIGMGPQKCKDFAYAVGPWITTIDEFEDLSTIPMEVRINGEVWASGNSGNMLWSPEELLAYVSLGEWIEPGDIIGSGTMGKGSSLELDREVSPGDLIEMEVGKVGVLRNRLGPRQDAGWWPTERAPFM